MTQTVGSVTPVTITPKAGKSSGARTIYYNGATTLPTSPGSYAVTFDVAATTGWNAASGLAAGTLTITALRTVNFNSGTANYVTGNPATASNNTVNIGASFSGSSGLNVFRGNAQVGDASGLESGKTAAAAGNTVNIAGGTFTQVYGGTASSHDGPANASNNTVNFTGGTVYYLYGGSAAISLLASTAVVTATGNRVFISGGTVNGDVYGGYSWIGAGTARATGNTVTISGAPTMTTANLYGGFVNDGSSFSVSKDAFTGNTLNLRTSGLTVRGLQNFEAINFYLPSNTANATTLLTSTNPVDITGVTVNLAYDTTAPSLSAGDVITLINGVTGTFTTKTVTVSGHSFQLSVSGGKLIATLE